MVAPSVDSFLVQESQPSGLSGPYTHAPCWLKASLSLKLRCRAPQLPPAFFSGQKMGLGLTIAASGGFVRPKKWSRLEVGQKSQNLESSQNGLAYSGKS